jgi:glycosyltransferase involved in cell wall biosynthesis
MKPIITIAIPSYNKESYIKRCIDSVLQQDITKRIIVIDNQSTDNTWEIINTYGEEVIKVQNDSNL